MKIGETIIKELIKEKEVISATVVGSYSENINIDKIGDLDIVVICKKLSKKTFFNIIRRVKKKNINMI